MRVSRMWWGGLAGLGDLLLADTDRQLATERYDLLTLSLMLYYKLTTKILR